MLITGILKHSQKERGTEGGKYCLSCLLYAVSQCTGCFSWMFNVISNQVNVRCCFLVVSLTDIRSLPDVAMTGNCTQECSELGHSDACWMPGQPSPIRKTRNPPKLSTFVPYQERGSLGRLANGSARLGGGGGGSSSVGGEEPRSRIPPSRSAYSNTGGHAPSQDCPLEEVPLSVASDYPPTSPPSSHTSKREIYL